MGTPGTGSRVLGAMDVAPARLRPSMAVYAAHSPVTAYPARRTMRARCPEESTKIGTRRSSLPTFSALPAALPLSAVLSLPAVLAPSISTLPM